MIVKVPTYMLMNWSPFLSLACRHREDLHRLQASADAGGQVADPGPHIQKRCPGRIPQAVPKGPAIPEPKVPQAFVLSRAHVCRPKISGPASLGRPHMSSCSYPACICEPS